MSEIFRARLDFALGVVVLGVSLFVPQSQAQTPTAVSGTVTDVNGLAYANARVSATLIPTTASPTIIVNGIPTQIGGQFNAGTDVNGNFSLNLFCNTAGGGCSVISPSGTTWQITITTNGAPPPLGTGPQACTATLTISGASQSVTSSFSACPPLSAPGGNSSNPSTFFGKYMGKSPNDFGAKGDTKFCYDGVVSGAPSTTFKSLSTATITNTVLTNNVATYTISAAQPLATGSLVTVTGTSNGGGIFNVTNVPILNYQSGVLVFSVSIIHANVSSAADSGTATSSCAAFTTADAGKTIEILQGGLVTPLDVSTTISSVQSSSQVTLTAAAGTNAAGKKFWYATDDTAALQSWVAAINAGIPTATGLQIHSGYLAGLYFTTKPLRFVNPLASTIASGSFSGIVFGVSGGGYGITEPWNLANANESLSIWGQGAYRTGFVAGSQFNWAAFGTALNTGVFYYSGWNGPTLQNFSVISPDYGIAFNTSALTGTFGAIYDDANGHVVTSGLYASSFHNTTSSLVVDQKADGTFESQYNNTQIFNSDCAAVYGSSAAPSTRGLSFWNYYWGGNRGSGCSPGAQIVLQNNNAVSAGERGPIVIDNSVIDNESGSADIPAGTGLINIANASLVDDSDEIRILNTRIQTQTGNSFLASINAGACVKLSFTNVNIVDTAAGASTNLFLNQSPCSTINFFGGSLGCFSAGSPVACANGISNASGSTVYLYGTRQFGTVGTVGTGASSVFAITPGATGWTGPGTFQATGSYSNQGTALTTITAGAGWGTSATAVPCATRSGFTQTGCFVITSGSAAFAAAPTVTVTLPSPLPSTATPCTLDVHAITGAGGAILFDETTLSTTAPVFTATTSTGGAFTPAAGETYTVILRCGP